MKFILALLLLSTSVFAQVSNIREFGEDTVTFSGDGSMVLPLGPTSTRPVAPLVGMIRYNSTINQFELYGSVGWELLVDGTALDAASQDIVTLIGTTSQDIITQLDVVTQDVADNTALIGTTSQDIRTDLDLKEPAITTLSIAKGGTGSGTQNFVDLTAAQTIDGVKTFSDELTLTELVATPSTPVSGDKKVYCLDDDKCYQLNDAGVETELGSGSGGGVDLSAITQSIIPDVDYNRNIGANGFAFGNMYGLKFNFSYAGAVAGYIALAGGGSEVRVGMGSGKEFVVAGDDQMFVDMTKGLQFRQISSPNNPTFSDTNKLYFKSDDKLYSMDSNGVEKEIGAEVDAGASVLLDNLGSTVIPSVASTYSATPVGASSTVTITADTNGVAGDSISVTGAASAGGGGPIVLQTWHNELSNNSTPIGIYDSRQLGQVFQAVSNRISSVEVFLYRDSSHTSDNVNVTFQGAQQVSPFRPTGSVIQTADETLDTATLGTVSGEWKTFNFTPALVVTVGTWYSLNIVTDGTPTAIRVPLGSNQGTVKSYTRACNLVASACDDYADWTEFNTWDATFKVYGNNVVAAGNKTVDTLIGEWNASNTLNTATVSAGGTEEPDVGVVITLSGGVDQSGGDTSINASLTPDSPSVHSLGSVANGWEDVFAKRLSVEALGFYYASEASSQSCDTTCDESDLSSGFVNGSGLCIKAWTSSSIASTCATASADNKCLCAGAR